MLTGTGLDGGLTARAEFEDTTAAYGAVGVTDIVIHRPRSGEPYAGDPALLEHLMA